uniref:Uncharacterized protein n=1 Tax=Anguilla anguilla TaxID=7936 RepID=A0A0E9SMB4_ANGAN
MINKARHRLTAVTNGIAWRWGGIKDIQIYRNTLISEHQSIPSGNFWSTVYYYKYISTLRMIK